MAEPARAPYYTLEEYVSLEARSNVRHEYYDGRIYAMAGGTIEHGGLCASAIAQLSEALAGRPCRVFTSDVRVRIQETGLDTYPDVSVVCGKLEHDPEDKLALANPVLLVEVTSPSTAGYDRGEKLAHYQRIPSLRGILVVDHAEIRLELWRRDEGDAWRVTTHGRGERVPLPALDGELSVDALYRDPLAGG